MFAKKQAKPQTRIDCLIGVGTRIEGDLTFSGGLRIDGQVLGNIRSVEGKEATLVISEQARVTGEIHVSHAMINGSVTGPIFSSDYLELQPKAQIVGDVEYSAIEVALGAVVQGRLICKAAEAKVALLPAPTDL